jgi:hypothetical protein
VKNKQASVAPAACIRVSAHQTVHSADKLDSLDGRYPPTTYPPNTHLHTYLGTHAHAQRNASRLLPPTYNCALRHGPRSSMPIYVKRLSSSRFSHYLTGSRNANTRAKRTPGSSRASHHQIRSRSRAKISAYVFPLHRCPHHGGQYKATTSTAVIPTFNRHLHSSRSWATPASM